MKAVVFTLLMAISVTVSAQTSKQDSLWAPFKFFVGEWHGEAEGQSGKGTYERSYQFTLKNRFIEIKNTATYPPQEANKKGEVHEDRGFISYDQMRKTFVLRQFHVEGFVNQYKLESISDDGKTITFVTEGIENIPDGFRAKEVYQLTSDNEFTETFSIAEPGKDFEVYSTVKLKKK